MTAAQGRLSVPEAIADCVPPDEYARLLGYPPGHRPAARQRSLAATSREWYGRFGRPWVFERTLFIRSIGARSVVVEDGRLDSPVLARRLSVSGATALSMVALSAGPEVDEQADRLWAQGRPDEAFFLDRFGVAVAEHLAVHCGQTLHRHRRHGLAGLPGYSPGYSGWPLEQQTVVWRVLTADPARALPGPLQVFGSGMLSPRNSMLAVFGLTPQYDAADVAWRRERCAWCSLARCDYRRETVETAGDSETVSG